MLRQAEQQPHDQGGPEALFRWINALLHQERRAHAGGDVERRDKPKIGPVESPEDQPVAEHAPDRVSGHKHPLGARRNGCAEFGELDNEGISGGDRRHG